MTTERADLAELSLDELEDELATLASHLYAGTCRWLELRARLAPEDATLFLRALQAARESLWQRARREERGSAEPRGEPRRVANVEAFVAMAEAALAQQASRSGGDRYQVVVHVDEAV